MTITLTIPGQPIAQKRPRFARRGKNVVTYSDQETEAGRALLFIRQEWGGRPQIEGAISLTILFYFRRPKSHYGSGRSTAGVLKKSAPGYHAVKPDIDNCVKFVLDVCSEIWRDDCQVDSLVARKLYCDHDPKTVIEIHEAYNG